MVRVTGFRFCDLFAGFWLPLVSNQIQASGLGCENRVNCTLGINIDGLF